MLESLFYPLQQSIGRICTPNMTECYVIILYILYLGSDCIIRVNHLLGRDIWSGVRVSLFYLLVRTCDCSWRKFCSFTPSQKIFSSTFSVPVFLFAYGGYLE
uniref:Ovule protein n=1 Tax=Strongyloides venezuelensis TaxID=75913 RepID=A0A0K0FDA0_STRVS